MKNYNDLLKKIMEKGIDREGRNGWTRGLFTEQLRFNLQDGFPAVTTKKLAFRVMAAELICFLSGVSDNNEFKRLGCYVWNDNANSDYWKPKAKYDGDLGRIYGVQWRTWKTPDGKEIDQLKNKIDQIKKDPHDRRLIVTAWNPAEIEMMSLPACHILYQFGGYNGKLSLHMVQRSCDMFLGVPFNISSYALLLHIVSQVTGMVADELVITFVDAHIYKDHFDAVKEQVARTPFKLPKLWINPEIRDLDDLKSSKLQGPKDVSNLFKLENYEHHPEIKAKMIV